MLKKLPIGIQNLREIIEENYVYIDKTRFAHKLIATGKYYFLSRPRRFGKSLFIDTLHEIFNGNKPLFKGLYIEDKWDWEDSYPVIKIDFSGGGYQTEFGIDKNIRYRLTEIMRQYEVECENTDFNPLFFDELIKELTSKFQKPVAILIDEYDKPILDNIADPEMALKARDSLRDFYGIIKNLDSYLKFVLITGVSKFSKTNLFSQLNNLLDITINSDYAAITGYTQNDLEAHFMEHLQDVNVDMLKRWYNGYNYFGEPLYNPFDILLFISNQNQYRNYWWETGSPKFLIDKLKEGDYYIPNLENCIVGEETLNSIDVENIDLIALLWQTGYLTFAEKIENQITGELSYKMRIPNLEIQLSLNALFKSFLTDTRHENKLRIQMVQNQILKHEFEALNQSLTSFFASIPYNNYVKNTISRYEGYYASVMYTFFAALGFELIAEEVTNRGRIDITLKTSNSIMIFEFKVDSSEPPIRQIKEQKYAEKYRSEGKEIYLIGILFSSEERNIAEFIWEKHSLQ